MKDMDRHIQEALNRETDELFKEAGGEQGLLEMVAESFRGKMRWLMVVNVVVITVMFAVGVFAVFRFFAAETTRAMLAWFGLFFVIRLCYILAREDGMVKPSNCRLGEDSGDGIGASHGRHPPGSRWFRRSSRSPTRPT